MIDRFALIIGAMKAGTTSLFDNLAAHPNVAAARPKEPGFFAFDEIHSKGRTFYESLFSFDPAVHSIALDGSTDYAKHPHCGDVPARIRAFGGEFRLIYSLRHPLRRIESHAQHVQHNRREVGRIDSDKDDHSLDAGISPVNLDISRYAAQIDQYRDYFDRGAMLITSVERLAADPAAVMREACLHLDVDPALLPERFEKRNEGKAKRPGSDIHPLWRAAAAVGPLRSAARALVPHRVRHRWRMNTRPETKVEGRFRLYPAEEAALIEALAPDLRRLRDVYGFDCGAEWGLKV